MTVNRMEKARAEQLERMEALERFIGQSTGHLAFAQSAILGFGGTPMFEMREAA